SVRAQAGYGPAGSNPEDNPEIWTWFSAEGNTGEGDDDEYMATISAPSDAGTYDYAYRFSTVYGHTWTYCDDGNADQGPQLPGEGSDDGYNPAHSGVLTVKEEIFISEYIEGSSHNKAIEIYNGTSSEISLEGYSVETYFNGATSPANTIDPGTGDCGGKPPWLREKLLSYLTAVPTPTYPIKATAHLQ
ncbi:MAG: lamin tail domain-containing protein, partial [bacterium]